MKIKIFGKAGCAKCETTKNKLTHYIKKWDCADAVSLEFVNMDTIEGMADGAYYDVIKIPTTIIEKDDTVTARWEEEIPNSEDVKKYFESILAKV